MSERNILKGNIFTTFDLIPNYIFKKIFLVDKKSKTGSLTAKVNKIDTFKEILK